MKRNAEWTKKAILDIAEQEFASKGFAGARVDEIANNCGVNKRMIYHYFEHKQGLYEKVIHRALHQVFESSPNISGESPIQALTLSIEAYFDYCIKHPAYISLMIREMVTEWEIVNQIMLTTETNWRDLIIQKIEEGKQQKVFHHDIDTEFFLATTVSQIFCFLPMLKHRNLIREETQNKLEEYKTKYVQLILRSILLPSTGNEGIRHG